MATQFHCRVGTVLRGPEDVVQLVRDRPFEQGTVVVSLDIEQRAVASVFVANETDVECAVECLTSRRAEAAVVVTVRADDRPSFAEAALTEFGRLRTRSSISLLDWIVVAGHRWRAMSECADMRADASTGR